MLAFSDLTHRFQSSQLLLLQSRRRLQQYRQARYIPDKRKLNKVFAPQHNIQVLTVPVKLKVTVTRINRT